MLFRVTFLVRLRPPPLQLCTELLDPVSTSASFSTAMSAPLTDRPSPSRASSAQDRFAYLEEKVGAACRTAGPLQEKVGAACRTAGPLQEKVGAACRTAGPLQEKVGAAPACRTAGPLSLAYL
jgi:hypothetical protein